MLLERIDEFEAVIPTNYHKEGNGKSPHGFALSENRYDLHPKILNHLRVKYQQHRRKLR